MILEQEERKNMSVVSLCLIAIVCTITAVLLKTYKQEFSMLMILALSMFFLTWMLNIFGEIQEEFNTIISELEQNKAFYKILFKILGITYVCEFSAGICKDAGYSSIASQIEIVGKMLIFLSGLPVLVSVVESIRNYKV